MFILDQPVQSGPDLLVEIGFDTQAIQQILDEPATFDVRGEDEER